MFFIIGKSIDESYLNVCRNILEGEIRGKFLVIYIQYPFKKIVEKYPTTLNIEDWINILNIGDIFRKYSDIHFYRKSFSGYMGIDWIKDSINDLFKGNYYKKISTQIDMITRRLRSKMHGSSTNALICSLYTLNDLKRACRLRPCVKGIPSLILIDFKPIGDKLNLYTVFRSQYIDTNTLGNLISLAILLYRIAIDTKYTPGILVSTIHNITFKDKRHKKLLQQLVQ